jgi:hypothetical protein
MRGHNTFVARNSRGKGSTMAYRLFVFFFTISAFAACKPSNDPPPDILKSQREAMDKAKAVGNQIQQSNQERMKQVDGDQGN